MIASDIGQTKDYVLKAEQDQLEGDVVTVFKLRTLTARRKARIQDDGAAVTEDRRISVRTGSIQFNLVRYGVEGWSDLLDSNGNQVVPEIKGTGFDSHLSDESMDRIAGAIRELAEAVAAFNEMGEDDEGN